MNREFALIADNITKTFSTTPSFNLLQGISFDVCHGESLAVTGRSGSGKSTLLHILAALEAPSNGSVTICGKKVCEKNSPLIRSQHVGFIFQAFHLLEDFSLIENVLMPGKIARQPTGAKSILYERALYLLDRVGLVDKKEAMIKTLSGGEKQRACLARALCMSPSIIFADEPTGNLDSYHAEKVSMLLFELVKQEKKTLLLVTHDPDLSSLCDKTFQLKGGFLHAI